MRRTNIIIQDFQCPVCRNIMCTIKKLDQEEEHMKTIYCTTCKVERNFIMVDYNGIRTN